MFGKKIRIGAVKIAALILSVMLCFAAFWTSIPVIAGSSSEKVIRVGAFPYDDQLAVDADGNYSGYGFDYLQELSRYTDWKYEFVNATWEESLVMLENGELDLLGSVMKSPEREQAFDFSDRPMISGYGVLATPRDNDLLAYEDFAAFDGLSVGCLKGNRQADNFISYCQQHKTKPNISYYNSYNEMQAALDTGKIDAVIMASTLRSPSLRVVAKFGENDSYFATTKGNTEVLSELNYAMQQITFNEPYFNSELNQKYYDLQAVTPISFTEEELSFIKESRPIRCLYNPAERPISYYDEKSGQPQGIAVDVSKLLQEKTGLTFELIQAQTTAESEKLLKEGKADLILSVTHDFSWAQRNNAILTDSYLNGQMVRVTGNEASIVPVIALYSQISEDALQKEISSEQSVIKYYSSVTNCLDAVYKGEAGATYLNSVIMSYEGGNPRYSRLKITPLYGFSAGTCIAVSNSTDPMLALILNKALKNISATQVNQIVSSNLKTEPAGNLAELVYTRPLEAILLLCGLGVIILLVLFFLFRSRAQNARSMKKMLYTDALTGFPNYKALAEDVPKLIESQPDHYALLYMDMHQFKTVNDAFGYDAGDRVLKSVSDILHSFIGEEERFARVYADKFVLLLQYEAMGYFEIRLKELSKRLEALACGEFETANFLFSGGIYRFPKDNANLDMAFDRANYAKDTVKEHFVNTFVFYDDVMRNQALVEKSLESSMLSALERGEFVPFYQPKVNVITGDVVGVEALVRWKHPEKGYLPPDSFLPFYEKNGFIVRIDFTVFEMVCQNLREWLDRGNAAVPVSVNFSRRHMQDRHFVEKLTEIADRYQIPSRLLEIEITETIALESIEIAVKFAGSLKECGFSLSIDDYGTGYSSISFLQNLPLDVLKLDKEFIASAMKTPKARDLMSHLIMAMKNNGIHVMCEGIETPEQRDFIISLNCMFAQGFLYSKPLPREEFEVYLKQHGISCLNYLNFVPTSSFSDRAWLGTKDFLGGIIPGWIMGCYMTEGNPIFYISQEFLATLGYSELECQTLYGGLFLNFLHPDDLSATAAEIKQNSEEYQLQYRMKKKDGSYLWIRNNGKRILTDNGKDALLGVCTDITDMVVAQQQKESLISAIPGGVCELDLSPEGPVILSGTDNFYHCIGRTRQEMEALENKLFAVVHADDLQNALDNMLQACRGEDKTCECAFRVEFIDGSLHWLSIRASLRESAQGKCATAIVFNIDEEVERTRLPALCQPDFSFKGA